jgi:hypothetical protein
MRGPDRRWVAVHVAAVAMLAWSCSSLPTAPTPDPAPAPTSSTPAFVRVAAGTATPFGATGTVNSVSKDVDGAKGGSFSYGNFKLVVPAGAFAGKATLTITVPDPSVMRCALSISPPEANAFAVPVLLVSDCSKATNLNTLAMQTLWYDELNSVWVVVPGSTVNASALTITTPLAHFSEYGVVDSKAGW